MKFLYFLIIMMTFSACTKDTPNMDTDPDPDPDPGYTPGTCEYFFWDYDRALELIPIEEYLNSKYIVFKDSFGGERQYELVVDERTMIAECSNRREAVETYWIDFVYTPNELHNLSLTFAISNGIEGYSLPKIAVNHDPENKIIFDHLIGVNSDGTSDQGKFAQKFIINGTDFENVIYSGELHEYPVPFSSLFFSHKLGVVGFADGNGHLWSFDRFME